MRDDTGALSVRPPTIEDVSALFALRAQMFRAMGAGDVASLQWQQRSELFEIPLHHPCAPPVEMY
ncbi:hypothetical protein AOC05_11960 [Arthrobacter alpinus]|uniref:Uncharacterized protein n=1 Tax=Arthrobacter alpinus TaxID=656366 RepID=A0A0M4RCG6_9MICC|nr:hypothetical protein AOC05_11960 [Arthrobacter alpinus]